MFYTILFIIFIFAANQCLCFYAEYTISNYKLYLDIINPILELYPELINQNNDLRVTAYDKLNFWIPIASYGLLSFVLNPLIRDPLERKIKQLEEYCDLLMQTLDNDEELESKLNELKQLYKKRPNFNTKHFLNF